MYMYMYAIISHLTFDVFETSIDTHISLLLVLVARSTLCVSTAFDYTGMGSSQLRSMCVSSQIGLLT